MGKISQSYLKELHRQKKYQSGGFSTKGYKRNSPDQQNFSVKKSNIPGANKGLFSNTSMRKGQLIGLAHENSKAVGTLGNMHNHSETPNMRSVKIGNQRYLYADKDITPGDELTTNYRFQPELEQPEDFMGNKRYGQKGFYKPDFRSKSQIAASQGNTGDSTKVAPRINPVDIRKGKEAGLQRAIANQPAFNQGYQKTGFDIERSDYYRKQKELKDALKNVDVVTDVMQLGNFIPHPAAQIIGKVGNWLGAATDVTQAGMDYGNENYGGMGINLASAMVPTALGAASFRRNSKYLRPGQPLYPFSPQARMSNLGPNVINLRTSRVNYIEPFTKVRGMTDKNLLANRALLGTLGAETAYDAGAFDNSTRLGLPIKPININKPNYQGGGTTDSDYMNFVRTLPPNLAQPNDPSYNLKGYWEASGSPKSFDYNQPTDPQGYYHAFSRDPRTGQILKAPFHPSFKEGVSDKGAYKLVNPRGDVYTQGFKYPAYEGYYGLPKNAIIDNNYDFLDKPNYEGYFQMGGTMSVPGVNGQVVSSGPQPLTSVKKTRGPITKNKKGDIKTMSNQQVKQVLKYSKQKPNKI